MANRWEAMETMTDFIFLGSKITVDSDCRHEIQRRLLLGKKAVTNLKSILKKVCLVKALVFPVVMHGCESCTLKKAEHWRIDTFEPWCWRRLLRVPLDCKEIKAVNCKGNQSWIFIGSADAEAETPMPPDAKNWLWKRPWCWERLKAGGEGDDRGWDGWMASPTRWTWVWASSSR